MEQDNLSLTFGVTHEAFGYIPPTALTSIRDVPRLAYNPFLIDMTVKKKPSYKKVKEIERVNEDQNLVVAEENFKDKEAFVRIFINSDNKLYDTSGNACRLLIYLLTEKTNFNSDFVILNPSELSNILQIKRLPATYKAIIELVEKGVIAGHTEKNVYWINPKIIYFGNRGLIRFKV